MGAAGRRATRGQTFTEKSFYLGEFRDRTLAIALMPGALHALAPVERVLKQLEANPTDVVLLGPADELGGSLAPGPLVSPGERLEGDVWRGLRRHSRVGVALDEVADVQGAVHEIALRLGVPKLVWLDPAGGLSRAGERLSFVDLVQLGDLLRAGVPGESAARRALLARIHVALEAGLPAVNLCTGEGLGDELFTYAGSGTLLTRERYVDVRRLRIDDYDAADDLISRGVSEGYLAKRSEEDLDRVFANGYGAFVEGRHLAGIGALLPCAEVSAGEIVSLYTLTRFLGEGIGGHLVRALCRTAQERGFEFVFACTTTERVAGFFERVGFRRVQEDEIPAEKWRHYDPKRRPRVRCIRRELAPPDRAR
jgi:amino-acid N-acetyltransferase